MTIEIALVIIVLCVLFRELIALFVVAVFGVAFLAATFALICLIEAYDKAKDWIFK